MTCDYVGKVFAKSCERMDEIPDTSVQCVVTSPPYYGLRRYDENAVMLRRDLSEEERAKIIAELDDLGIKSR